MPSGTGSAFAAATAGRGSAWIGQELLAAARRAEVVRLAVVLRPVLGRVRVHPHAAHRVLHAMLGIFASAASAVVMVTMLLVIVGMTGTMAGMILTR